MFVALLAGVYGAYKHFSGFDPLKLDPQAIVSELIKAKTPQQVLTVLSSIKVPDQIAKLNPQKDNNSSKEPAETKPQSKPTGKVAFKFLLFADSHNDNSNLRKVLSQAKGSFPEIQFIIGLGDYTEVGTIEELKQAKSELDLSSLRYFLIPGDHDLWDARDKQNIPNSYFKQLFGPTYQSFTYNNFRFILLYNSDNYAGMDQDQFKWLDLELEKAKQDSSKILVFVHEPLYHPSSDHVMGRVEKELKNQAKDLIHRLKEANVKKIFAGDIHYFSEYEEPETNLSMITIGAVVTSRNPQSPRFAVISVYEDGEVGVEDIEIR